MWAVFVLWNCSLMCKISLRAYAWRDNSFFEFKILVIYHNGLYQKQFSSTPWFQILWTAIKVWRPNVCHCHISACHQFTLILPKLHRHRTFFASLPHTTCRTGCACTWAMRCRWRLMTREIPSWTLPNTATTSRMLSSNDVAMKFWHNGNNNAIVDTRLCPSEQNTISTWWSLLLSKICLEFQPSWLMGSIQHSGIHMKHYRATITWKHDITHKTGST